MILSRFSASPLVHAEIETSYAQAHYPFLNADVSFAFAGAAIAAYSFLGFDASPP